MFLASISSSVLTVQFVHSDTANLRTLHVPRASLWTALPVFFFMMLPCGVVQAKALKLAVLPVIVHPPPCCGRIYRCMRVFQVFLGLF